MDSKDFIEAILWSFLLGAVVFGVGTRVGWGYRFIGQYLDRWFRPE